MKIVGLAPFYNVESAHYPYLESIISAMPLVDEMVINDGGCLDKTIPHLKKLRDNVYPNIRFFNARHRKDEMWKGLDIAIERTLKSIDADWIIEIQADEYFLPSDYNRLRAEIERAHKEGKNGIRQVRYDVLWDYKIEGYQYNIIRIFRNLPNVRSFAGGDCFYFEGEPYNREGFQTHNLPPELDSEVDFYHFKGIPMNKKIQAQRHNKHYALNHTTREDINRNITKQLQQKGMSPIEVTEENIIDEVPQLYRDLLKYSRTKYVVRPELFDRDYLKELGYL